MTRENGDHYMKFWTMTATLVALTSLGCTAETSSEKLGDTSADLSAASSASPTLDVDFTNCHEYAGLTPVATATLAPYVPAPYVVAEGAPGYGNVVVRSVRCASASINGGPATPGTITQIGVNIVSPDGTGDINNYVVFYLASDPKLVYGLRQAGISADWDPDLVFAFDEAKSGATAHFVDANAIPEPPLLIDSTVNTPTSATVPINFVANWYESHGAAHVEMHSTYPGILFGANSSGVNVYTTRGSGLAKLLGATEATFSSLSIFNVIPSSHMHVAGAP